MDFESVGRCLVTICFTASISQACHKIILSSRACLDDCAVIKDASVEENLPNHCETLGTIRSFFWPKVKNSSWNRFEMYPLKNTENNAADKRRQRLLARSEE